MSTKCRIAAALLRLFPKAWRGEYGAELEDLLLTRPLTAHDIVNVALSGAGQRLRDADPALLCGCAFAMLIALSVVWNVAALSPPALGWIATLAASGKTLPTVMMKPFSAELYSLALAACGYAVVAWRGGSVRQAGTAALKVSLLAGAPFIVVGLAMFVGALDTLVLEPGAASPAHEGLAYTYVSAEPASPTPLDVIAAPLFALPGAWLWGLVGGALARATRPRRPQNA